MIRKTMQLVTGIPAKYSNSTCVVASHEGEVAVGMMMDDESEAFLIPEAVFQKLLMVYADYLDQIGEELSDPNRTVN